MYHVIDLLYMCHVIVNLYSYNSVTFSDDSIEHRLELGSFEVHNLTPNTPPIYQVLR